MKNYKQFYLDQIKTQWRPLFEEYNKNNNTALEKLLMDTQRYIRIMPKNIQEPEKIAEYITEKIKDEFTIPTKMGDRNQIALNANIQSILPKIKKQIIQFHKNFIEFADIKNENEIRNLFREALIYCIGISKLYMCSPLKI